MAGRAALLVGLLLASCEQQSVDKDAGGGERPSRIVSLDYCADQFVLKLADREQILALSPDAEMDFSFMRDAADGLPKVRPVAEDVLTLQPDLIVRSYGGGPNAGAHFARAGVPVLQVGWATTVDGEELDSIPSLIQHMADGMGQTERGRELVAEFRSRLAAIQPRRNGGETLYMTPAGVTTGPGSLVHELLLAAGLENFQRLPGWRSIPLERLAYEQPDLVAAAFFESRTNHPNAWSAARHPVAKSQLENLEVVSIQGAWTSCGGWFLVEAVEALAASAAK